MSSSLKQALRDWSDEATVPPGLADRALAGRRREVRRRMLPAAAGLVAGMAAVAVVVPGLWGSADGRRPDRPAMSDELAVSSDLSNSPPQHLVAAGDVAVSAVYDIEPVTTASGAKTLRRSYRVLDPTSDRYEPVDWSYVTVAPGLEKAAVLEGELPASRIGILDLRTDDVRWITTDHPVAALAWDADGRRLVGTSYDGDPDRQPPPMGTDAVSRTGFVLVDPVAETVEFHALPSDSAQRPVFGRVDLGFTTDGAALWSSGVAGPALFNLDGTRRPVDQSAFRELLGPETSAQLPATSSDGRYTITRDAGLPTAITDNHTGEVHRQRALQVLAWADDEHVITLGGCRGACEGMEEFKNGLVLMRYDGTEARALTAIRNGEGEWYFSLTLR